MFIVDKSYCLILDMFFNVYQILKNDINHRDQEMLIVLYLKFWEKRWTTMCFFEEIILGQKTKQK